MKIQRRRKQDLVDHISKDYDLLKDLEDALRLADDPKRRAELRSEIDDLKGQIDSHEQELDSVKDTLEERLQTTVDLYLSTSFDRDLYAELDQAGETDPERGTLLQKVFIDLEVKVRENQRLYDIGPRTHISGRKRLPESGKTISAMKCFLKEYWPKITIIGGPGHGKSTLGQHLAQVHRAKLLDKPWEFTPHIPRIPFRVVLKYFAQWLDQAKDTDHLENYLAEMIQKLTGRITPVEDIQQILKNRPCLLILDGLDEVVIPDLRERMLSRVREFLNRTERLEANLMVIATSRPTGYENQFDPEQFWHLELPRLSENKVREFAKKWTMVKKLREEEQERVLHTLEECLQDKGISVLLTTPLQVTIVLLVIKDGGRPPSQREALFNEYWGTILRREKSKAKGIIQTNESLMFDLHSYLGYLLHHRATKQNVQSLLLEDEFKSAIRAFLRRKDSHTSEKAIDEKMDLLVNEARYRLVLIVEPQPGLFGFELRSIQEFFAAVHLLQTAKDTAQRFQRLKAIAASEHWRNVALFFAGRVARSYGGETSNILELVCRPVDRDELNRFLHPGAWFAFEIAADGAFGVSYRDLQYNAIEYGLDVLEPHPARKQEENLRNLISRLSPEDRQEFLRPVMENKLRSLAMSSWGPVLNLYGRFFGTTTFFQEKMEMLLQAQRSSLNLESVLDLAMRYELDSARMAKWLGSSWPSWKDRMIFWWQHSPAYFEKVFNMWSPSTPLIIEMIEGSVRDYWRFPIYPFREGSLPSLSEPVSLLDQLFTTLRCMEILSDFRRGGLRSDKEIRLGRWGGITVADLERKRHTQAIDQLALFSRKILERSDLHPWLRALLWSVFWLTNEPNDETVSNFLSEHWSTEHLNLLSTHLRHSWPLLGLVANLAHRNQLGNVEHLLPMLRTEPQKQIAADVRKTLHDCAKYTDVDRKRLYIALTLDANIDELVPQLGSLSKQLSVSINDLVDWHVTAFTESWSTVTYTLNDLTILFASVEESLSNDDLSDFPWKFVGAKWPKALEIPRRLQHLLDLTLARWTETRRDDIRNLLITLAIGLVAYETDLEVSGSRIFTILSQEEFSLTTLERIWFIGEAIQKLPTLSLRSLKPFLDHSDPAVRAGAATFCMIILEALDQRSLIWNDKKIPDSILHELDLSLGLRLVTSAERRSRLAGITMLTFAECPMDDDFQKRLLSALKSTTDEEERVVLVKFLAHAPISSATRTAWRILLERVLNVAGEYSNDVLEAVIERYQEISSSVNPALSELLEQELGLP
jgi:hypothetical protein